MFRFCVGDRFFLCDNKILCEYDYEERMVFANLAYNSNNLAQIKQQQQGGPGGARPKVQYEYEASVVGRCFFVCTYEEKNHFRS